MTQSIELDIFNIFKPTSFFSKLTYDNGLHHLAYMEKKLESKSIFLN
jgi:hypothetical protein